MGLEVRFTNSSRSFSNPVTLAQRGATQLVSKCQTPLLHNVALHRPRSLSEAKVYAPSFSHNMLYFNSFLYRIRVFISEVYGLLIHPFFCNRLSSSDSSNKPCQHLPRPAFHKLRHLIRNHVLHALCPAYRRGQLF